MRMTACLLDPTPRFQLFLILINQNFNLSPVSEFCVGIQVGSFLSRLPDHYPAISSPAGDQKEAFQSHGLTVSIANYSIENTCQVFSIILTNYMGVATDRQSCRRHHPTAAVAKLTNKPIGQQIKYFLIS